MTYTQTKEDATKWFRFCVFLGRLGLFTRRGLRGYEPSWWPRARVLYPDGCSVNMAIGNACEHAAMFGGVVVPSEPKP